MHPKYTHAARKGVAATDHACVDFDNGKLPSGGGWTSVIAGGGTSTVTTQHASSLPDGWQTGVGTGDGSKAALAWHVAGAQPIASSHRGGRHQPCRQPGGLPALDGLGLAALCRVRFRSDLPGVHGGAGHRLRDRLHRLLPDDGVRRRQAATINLYQVYGVLQPNLWTRVQMEITAPSKQIQVTIPGATNAAVSGNFDPDTAVDVTVGPETSGATSGWSGYLDNIVINVARSS